MAEALLNKPGLLFFFPQEWISSDHVTSLKSKTLGNNPPTYTLPIHSLANTIYNSNKCFLATVAVIFEHQAHGG